MKIRGQRSVISRQRLDANAVECSLSCGHVLVRRNRESVRPTAICPSCRAANLTARERLAIARTAARLRSAEVST